MTHETTATNARRRLARLMEAHVQGQIKFGVYANLSEVVRAGVHMLMKRGGARQFHALKADLEAAVRDAEAGAFTEFDPGAYEPDAFPH